MPSVSIASSDVLANPRPAQLAVLMKREGVHSKRPTEGSYRVPSFSIKTPFDAVAGSNLLYS